MYYYTFLLHLRDNISGSSTNGSNMSFQYRCWILTCPASGHPCLNVKSRFFSLQPTRFQHPDPDKPRRQRERRCFTAHEHHLETPTPGTHGHYPVVDENHSLFDTRKIPFLTPVSFFSGFGRLPLWQLLLLGLQSFHMLRFAFPKPGRVQTYSPCTNLNKKSPRCPCWNCTCRWTGLPMQATLWPMFQSTASSKELLSLALTICQRLL